MKTIECISQIQVEHLRAWLFKVALHRYYTLYNKKKSVVFLTDDELVQFQSSLNIEEQIIVDEQHEKLRTALQGLSDTFSQLLVMKYFMELSYKEMANILEVSENHIRTYLKRKESITKTMGGHVMEDLFDVKKMEKSIGKAKRRSTWKTVFISVSAFFIIFTGG